jgi:hypothetical protein
LATNIVNKKLVLWILPDALFFLIQLGISLRANSESEEHIKSGVQRRSSELWEDMKNQNSTIFSPIPSAPPQNEYDSQRTNGSGQVCFSASEEQPLLDNSAYPPVPTQSYWEATPPYVPICNVGPPACSIPAPPYDLQTHETQSTTYESLMNQTSSTDATPSLLACALDPYNVIRLLYILFFTLPFAIFSFVWTLVTFCVSLPLLLLYPVGFVLMSAACMSWRILAMLNVACMDLFLSPERLTNKYVQQRNAVRLSAGGVGVMKENLSWKAFGYFILVRLLMTLVVWVTTLCLVCLATHTFCNMPLVTHHQLHPQVVTNNTDYYYDGWHYHSSERLEGHWHNSRSTDDDIIRCHAGPWSVLRAVPLLLLLSLWVNKSSKIDWEMTTKAFRN